MTERQRAFLFINDILESCQLIRESVSGIAPEDFERDRHLRESVIWRIFIIGEAATQLPEEIKNMAPAVPWHLVKGMRNRIAHQYFGLKYSVLWHTATVSIPEMEPSIRAVWEQLSIETAQPTAPRL